MPKLRQSNSGFTIIEVVLVLAIAAVIFLIVFLAVPALQRNNRNTGRKNDIGRALAVTSEYVSNHPEMDVATLATKCDDILKDTGAAGKFGVYDNTACTNVDIKDGSSADVTNPDDKDKFADVLQAKCDGTDATSASSVRNIVILWASETAGGQDKICQEG